MRLRPGLPAAIRGGELRTDRVRSRAGRARDAARRKLKLNATPIRNPMKNHSKSLTCAAVGALVLCLAPMAGARTSADSSSMDQSTNKDYRSDNGSARSSRMAMKDARKEHSAQKLMGRAVVGSDGEKLGDINDFVINPDNGRIEYVVVSSGGVLGIGDTLHLVPAAALTPATATTSASAGSMSASMSSDKFSVNIDKAKWKDAPKFQKDQLASVNDQRMQLDQYYDVKADTMKSKWHKHSDKNADMNAQCVLASDVIGKNIRSGDQKVGNIDDLVITWSDHRAAILLDPDHDFVATDRSNVGAGTTNEDMSAGRSGVSANSSRRMTGNGKYVVSFDKVEISGTGRDSVTTSLTKDQFVAATAGSAATAGVMNRDGVYAWQGWDADPGMNVSVHTTNDSSGWKSQSTTTGITSPGGMTTVMSNDAANSSRAATDQATVESVRRVLNDGSLPAAARQVQVSQENGKLVLTGTVPSKDLKNTIEDKVEKAANGWDVDNQISVSEKN
ncbi:PRC-barrel domain-containing protein [Horticoccus luteus]|uniref:PRC-barrel domain-containing protein n=1 Tax=Horticoccus luteus TaxID=2862869 RepID=A0A8F9TX82_9BACT|nr:PRC-barrel domain-containing protein [Horticoccus luteus]QYM79918.1 PRC-barrel domain-containing protein [Horticoccus luteus]